MSEMSSSVENCARGGGTVWARFVVGNIRDGFLDSFQTRREAIDYANRLPPLEFPDDDAIAKVTVFDRMARYGRAQEWDRKGNPVSMRGWPTVES